MNTEHDGGAPFGDPHFSDTPSQHAAPPTDPRPTHARPSVAKSRRVRGPQGRAGAHRTNPTEPVVAHGVVPEQTHGHDADALAGARPHGTADEQPPQREHERRKTQASFEPEHGHRAYQHRIEPESQRNTPPQGFVPLWDDDAPRPRITRRVFIAGGVAIAAAAAVFGIPALRDAMPISVTVNGQSVELSKEKTLQAAYEKSGIRVTPGNLVDIEGEIIGEGEGAPYIATIDGRQADAPDTPVQDGNALAFADGSDVEEPSVTEDKTVDPSPVESGHGPIHAIGSPGAAGTSTVKTGQTSGKEVVVEVIEPAQDRLYLRSYPDTGDDKAIALTFDDGPWEESTAAILDILRDNGATATFFAVGNRIAGEGVELVKRERDEGHQVCSHSWDHASGSGQGVNMGLMTPEEQRMEVEKGFQAIVDATGAEPSRVFRSPGGNFPIEVWRNVEDLLEAEIGWDIDTLDWKRPGASVIAERIKAATPGDIILMHDGGGDRSQTAEALRKALPYLKEQGFRFVTMDEMLQFPRKEG